MPFNQFQLHPSLINALPSTIVTPSPIQKVVIPEILTGSDILALAQTGSGKTYAYALPVLSKIALASTHSTSIQAVILVPTREIARQVGQSLQPLVQSLNMTMASLYGGVDINQQLQYISKNPALIIATPGRLLALINNNTLDLTSVEYLILDEADRLVDMGFWRDLQSIINVMPRSRQTLSFSATLADELAQKMHSIMQNARRVEPDRVNTVGDNIDEQLYLVNKGSKTKALLTLLSQHSQQALVFISAKDSADALTKKLVKQGIKAAALHGNKDQTTREQTLADFKQKNVQVLIATDLLARGIHIDALPLVINFDLPENATVYVHRVGRTARAGHTGLAISLVCHAETLALDAIRKLTQRSLPLDNLAGFPFTDQPSSGTAKRPARDKQANRRSAQKRSIKEFKGKELLL